MSIPTVSYTLNIPADQVGRIVTAFCASNGYQETLPDGTPNPVSPGEFSRQIIVRQIVEYVAGYEAQEAAKHAQATAYQAAMQEIVVS